MYTIIVINLRNFLIWFFVFLFLINGSLFIVAKLAQNKNNFADIASPIPELFESVLGKQASASDFWKPHFPDIVQKPELELTAQNVISYDLTTQKLLYAKAIDEKRPIASLTKIMTAVIALERMDMTEKFKISKKAAELGESTMGLTEGEVLAVEELLYGLMLRSGNDAAQTIAENSPYGEKGFVYEMNKKAEELGLTDTRFTNATGLQGDGDQHSTVKDLLVITRYALQNAEFAKIASTYHYQLPANSEHKEFNLYNETNLLSTYPGVKGVKTGFTDEAGMCLVSYLEHKDHKIIAVVLNSKNRRQEMKELLDYSLRRLGENPPDHI